MMLQVVLRRFLVESYKFSKFLNLNKVFNREHMAWRICEEINCEYYELSSITAEDVEQRDEDYSICS